MLKPLFGVGVEGLKFKIVVDSKVSVKLNDLWLNCRKASR
jgi:hypothetical protein